jgi:glycosyltransferase involved in cell wall biosynthesis
MFTHEQRQIRNKSYLESAKNSSLVLLFSEAVKRDFEKFAPQYAYKARVIHPVAHIPSWVYDHDPISVVREYSLPTKFIYLPNAFWKHKNHELVFGAIHDLRKEGINVVVVCDGYSEDYRHPGYFSELWTMVSRLGIRDQAIYAGLLPHDHVLALMRQSVCVLNPSLFEGWGMTVEEARSLGKKVLVSDIPAHREQNPPEATYFRPHDRDDLADKLKRLWNETAPGPDLELETISRTQSRQRIVHNAEAFISLIHEVRQYQIKADWNVHNAVPSGFQSSVPSPRLEGPSSY